MSSKIYNDPDFGPILLRKSTRARRISIRVHPLNGVVVTMPQFCGYSSGIAFFALKKGWVAGTLDRLRRRREELERCGLVPSSGRDAQTAADRIESMRNIARRTLPPRLARLAERYGFTYNRVAIKHNSSNWGSCSSMGNINLNLNLVRLPEPLCDHVILHELCHLKHPNHGPEFHALLERLDADNLQRLSENGEPEETLLRLRAEIRSSRAGFPVQHVLERELKKYWLI